MNIVLFNSETEGRFLLTSNGNGHAVLRIEGSPKIPDGDYAPSDLLDAKYETHAASVVYNWALEKFRSEQGIAAAQSYLRQWPDGPQAEPEDIEEACAANDAIMQAAEALNAGTPMLDEMSAEQLTEHIHQMVAKLGEEETGSATAYLLRLRINSAATMLYGFYHRAAKANSA